MLYCTYRTTVQKLKERVDLRVETVHVALKHDYTVALSSLCDGHGRAVIDGYGLFAQHVFSRVRCLDGQFGVQGVRRGDVDGFDSGVSEKFLEARVGTTGAKFFREGGDLPYISPGDGSQDAGAAERELSREAAGVLAWAEDSPVDFAHTHSFLPRFFTVDYFCGAPWFAQTLCAHSEPSCPEAEALTSYPASRNSDPAEVPR
ncbi:hypothetical protein QF047_004105 [Arthrobacter sp. W4I7]|nr:hypothetical protein [Arthrobacter sp. W4I7]MDQ0693145.1 hypothetical protein [Arthrobacter sp. W4I7]